MTDAWPIAVLTPRSISRRIAARTLAGTVAVSGFTQRVSPPAHAWVIQYDTIPLHTAQQIHTWDALEALLDGGANPILVPLCEGGRQLPITDPGGIGGITHSDGTLFSDDSGYYQPGVTAVFRTSALAGATSVSLTITDGGTLQAGHHFSVGERLYRISRITLINNTRHDVQIRPPLREAVSVGDPVDFSTLHVKCRLASDDQMALTLELSRYGFPSVTFVEDPSA